MAPFLAEALVTDLAADEASNQARPPWRASSPPAEAQGSVRFAHRTLSLPGTLPQVPLWDKSKMERPCEEAVEFVDFLLKWKEKAGRNQRCTG